MKPTRRPSPGALDADSPDGRPFGAPMPTAVFFGLAIASVGGPLALVALFLPSTLSPVTRSSGLVVLLGSLAFAFPVAVWYRYASRIASSGGLYRFVEAGAGTAVARIHGGIWVISYFLYLPSTIAYVFYTLLPAAFPGIAPYRAALELAVPAAMVLALVLWRIGLFSLTAALAFAQVALVGVLAGSEIARAGASASAFSLHVPAGSAAHVAASASLLYVCASLPLYLGAEVRRPTRTTARALPLALGVAGLSGLAGVVALDRLAPSALGSEVPGYSVGLAVSGRALADAVVVGAALSVLTLVLLEYVALTRLLPVMAGVAPRRAELGVGAAFVASAALSLINAPATYAELLNPSLVALYLSEAIVFAAYPLFRRRHGRLTPGDVLIAAGGSALMIFGLYEALQQAF